MNEQPPLPRTIQVRLGTAGTLPRNRFPGVPMQPGVPVCRPSLRTFTLSCIATLILLVLNGNAAPTNEWPRMKSIQPHGYVCYRAKNPLQVDGRLDEAAWAAVPWTEDFADIEGPAKPKPKYRTRAKMLWDDTYF